MLDNYKTINHFEVKRTHNCESQRLIVALQVKIFRLFDRILLKKSWMTFTTFKIDQHCLLSLSEIPK
jgi:hypothetical protein